RNPSWNRLGPYRFEKILPKSGLLTLVFGFPTPARLRKFKISARNSIDASSVNFKGVRLMIDTSSLNHAGPRMSGRCLGALPNSRPTPFGEPGGSEKASGFR